MVKLGVSLFQTDVQQQKPNLHGLSCIANLMEGLSLIFNGMCLHVHRFQTTSKCDM